MTDLTIKQTLDAPRDRVFAFMCEPAHLLKWWGPEAMHVAEHDLDFRAPGPWFAVLVNAEGQRYKMSGQVVSVSPPDSIELTWGWHDDADIRGEETKVRFSLAELDEGRTALTLTHGTFAEAENAEAHKAGWTSTLVKLIRLAKQE